MKAHTNQPRSVYAHGGTAESLREKPAGNDGDPQVSSFTIYPLHEACFPELFNLFAFVQLITKISVKFCMNIDR